MQMMLHRVVFLLLAVAGAGAFTLRRSTELHERVQLDSALERADRAVVRAANTAEAEEKAFLHREWRLVKQDLTKLHQAAVATVAALKPNSTTAPPAKEAAKPAAKKNLADTAVAAAKKGEGKDEQLSPADEKALAAATAPLAKLGKLGKGIMNQVALAPMLGMLKGLYEQGRERIGELNKREKEQKGKWEKHVAEHKHRLEEIERKFGNHSSNSSNGTLKHHVNESHIKGAEREVFRVNETKEADRMFSYWERCHNRQHKQYHNMLKIQHITMQREKQMIDMYEKVLNGTAAEKSQVGHKLRQMTGGGESAPEVVLLSTAQSVAKFCRSTFVELKTEEGELDAWTPLEPPGFRG